MIIRRQQEGLLEEICFKEKEGTLWTRAVILISDEWTFGHIFYTDDVKS